MNFLKIAAVELKRKQQEFSIKSLFLILPLLAVFVGIFAFISVTDYQPVTPVFGLETNSGLLREYARDSNFVEAKSYMDDEIVLSVRDDGNSVYVINPSGFTQRAAEQSLIKLLQETNNKALEAAGLVPPILLNISTSYREEFLQESIIDEESNDITQAQAPKIPSVEEISEANDNVPQTTTQVVDEQTTENPEEENVGQPTQEVINDVAPAPQTDGPIIIESNEEMQQIPAQFRPSSEDDINLITIDSLPDAEQGEGGVGTIDDLDSLQHIRHVFIAIQIVVVLNFCAVLFAASLFQEKLNQRSTLLFTMPISRVSVLAGKMLPYMALSGTLIVALLFLNGMPMQFIPKALLVAAVLSLLYFAVSYLSAIFARSHKEFSFLSVFMISLMSLYLIVPAFIANYSLLSNASLLTPLVLFVQNIDIPITTYAFLVGVYGIISAWIFALGATLFTFEEFYSYAPMTKKIVRMTQLYVRRWWHAGIFTFFSIPLGWLLQVVLIVILLVSGFSLQVAGMNIGLMIMILVAAFSEELLRNLPIYAAYTNSPHPKKEWTYSKGAKYSLASGIGFGIGEKLLLTVMISPFVKGYEQLASTPLETGGLAIIVGAGFFVPMMLHSALTFLVFCLLKNTKKPRYLTFIIIAAIVHAIYNILIITVLGGVAQP